MGEEAKQEQAVKAVEEEEKKEEKLGEESKENAAPLVLSVDLHCLGCAKKIEKILLRIRGVEEVVVDMATNQVTIKGIVDPHALCNKIKQRTKRRANILSPLPAAQGQPMPQLVSSQVNEPTTVELSVDMHCQACAEQLKRKILKMRGVQTAVTELSTGKVTVTGTMIADKLVDYVYRQTKKQARIVPQPEPEPEPKQEPEPEPEPAKQEENKEQEKPVEEAKPDDRQGDVEKKEEEKPAEAEEAKKEEAEKGGGNNESSDTKEQSGKNEENSNMYSGNIEELEHMKKSIYYYYHPPLYVIERTPPPQLFSDENPNACCIS